MDKVLTEQEKENNRMVIKNIEWDVDIDDGIQKILDMLHEDAAEILGVPKNTFANMTTSEREAYAYDVFRHSPDVLYEAMGLPEEVVLPENEEEWTNDRINDYLADHYSYCVYDYDTCEEEQEQEEEREDI